MILSRIETNYTNENLLIIRSLFVASSKLNRYFSEVQEPKIGSFRTVFN